LHLQELLQSIILINKPKFFIKTCENKK